MGAASMSLEPSEGYTSGESKSIEEVLEICQGKRDANEDSVFCTALNDISDIQAQIDALNVHIEETKEDPRYFLRNMAGLAARESVSFDSSSDHSSVILDLQSANFNAGGTNIGGAIQGVADDFTNGDFAWRPNTAAWVVVMTDGQDGTSPAGAVSNLIDSKGAGQPTVDILSVGIG